MKIFVIEAKRIGESFIKIVCAKSKKQAQNMFGELFSEIIVTEIIKTDKPTELFSDHNEWDVD